MSFHHGIIQLASCSTNLSHYPPKLDILQLRHGGNQLQVNAKRRHNARINPPPDDTTQATSQDTMLMKAKLRAVGLNELLGAASSLGLHV